MLAFLRRRRSQTPAVAAAGGAVLVAAGLAAQRLRKGSDPLERGPGLELAPPDAAAAALEAVVSEPDVPRGVGEAYRQARRAFNHARETGDGYEELHDRARVLWWAATYAEKPARPLARDARKLLGLLEERRDLLALAAAAGPDEYRAQRQAKLERQIAAGGKALFAIKPAKVTARIADADAGPAGAPG